MTKDDAAQEAVITLGLLPAKAGALGGGIWCEADVTIGGLRELELRRALRSGERFPQRR